MKNYLENLGKKRYESVDCGGPNQMTSPKFPLNAFDFLISRYWATRLGRRKKTRRKIKMEMKWAEVVGYRAHLYSLK